MVIVYLFTLSLHINSRMLFVNVCWKKNSFVWATEVTSGYKNIETQTGRIEDTLTVAMTNHEQWSEYEFECIVQFTVYFINTQTFAEVLVAYLV